MFPKRDAKTTDQETIKTEPEEKACRDVVPVGSADTRPRNTLLMGSRITGDICVSSDMDVSGEVQGNITSDSDADIHIHGVCDGSVHTKQGNIIVSGRVCNGDLSAGGSVSVMGSFKGGEVKAKEKILLNGLFEGTLKSKEIELGSKAEGRGEIIYGEFISIAKGAKIEAKIVQGQTESESEIRPIQANVVLKPPQQAKVAGEPPGEKKSPA